MKKDSMKKRYRKEYIMNLRLRIEFILKSFIRACFKKIHNFLNCIISQVKERKFKMKIIKELMD